MKYKRIILSFIVPLFMEQLGAMQPGSEPISQYDDFFDISYNNSSTGDGTYDPEVVRNKLNNLMTAVKVNKKKIIHKNFEDFAPNCADLVNDIRELEKKNFKGENVMAFGKKWKINGLDIYHY